jgi:pimeloyl-ACP methyl ester carboxylesterase
MGVFVLVHGTGHGGWCWQKVTPLLRAAGSEAFAPTLSGLGDRSHLADRGIDLSMHIREVAELMFYEDISDVVLVGHSYAGMVITGVASTAPERLKQLIYLDAYLPDEGQTEVDLWPPAMRAEIESGAAGIGGMRPPPTTELLGINDAALADWARPRITPHPMGTYTEPVPKGDARGAALPRAYIHCNVGPLVPLMGGFAAKARALGWPVREIATGHDAMLTEPDAVAQILLELAG